MKIIDNSHNLIVSVHLPQDAYAIQSFERGIAAQEGGSFAWEIVPVRHLKLR